MFYKVVQKHYLGEVGKQTVFLLPNLQVIFMQKKYSNWEMFAEVTAKNVGGVF